MDCDYNIFTINRLLLYITAVYMCLMEPFESFMKTAIAPMTGYLKIFNAILIAEINLKGPKIFRFGSKSNILD